MACGAVTTGQGFLVETLGHLDCQAQVIGSYGFQSLADPASPAASLLTALLTLFVALFGLRLLFGGEVAIRDAVGSVLKIGIVLTLALSWPAWRTLAYDTVLHGPSEIAATLGGDALPALKGGLADQLQEIDDGLVELTQFGTGRQTGALVVPGEGRSSFQGVALQDETGLGYGRAIFLASTIGSLGLLRIAAALLLAIAPLMAVLLLFDVTRGIFAGWMRGLVLTALGSLGISLLLAIEAEIVGSWLADALNRRDLGYATPGTPMELLALSLGFAVAAFALLALLGRVAFQNGWPITGWLRGQDGDAQGSNREERPIRIVGQEQRAIAGGEDPAVRSRASAVSEGVAASMRRETRLEQSSQDQRRTDIIRGGEQRGEPTPRGTGRGGEPLGSSYRRTMNRTAGSHRRRDGTR